MRTREPSRHVVLIAVASFAIGLSACANARTVGVASPTPSPVTGHGESIRWDHPILGGISKTTFEAAADALHFSVLKPSGIGTLLRIEVTPPDADESDDVLAATYTSQTSGTFLITEQAADTTAEALAAMASASPPPGRDAALSLVDLDDGTAALLIVGPVTVDVVCVRGGLQFSIAGPTATMARDAAISIASAVNRGEPV